MLSGVFDAPTRRQLQRYWKAEEVYTVIKVKIRNRVSNGVTSLNSQLHQKLEDFQNRTEPLSQQTDKLVSRMTDEGVEILNSKLDRKILVVWIWCQSQSALEKFQRQCESNQLICVFFGIANIPISEFIHSKIIDVDKNEYKKTVVLFSIFVQFMTRIDVETYEYVCGVTKLRDEIFVLCRARSYQTIHVIRVFEDRVPFRPQRIIQLEEIKYSCEIGCSEQESALYVAAYYDKCVWKITREKDEQHKIVKWLTIDYEPSTLSVSSDGQLLLVNESLSSLMLYGSDAELIHSIRLPKDIDKPRHAVATSTGHLIILHQWAEKKGKGGRESSDGKMAQSWIISEATRDGQTVIRRFIPSNETQKLNDPQYLSLDSDDQVFVADRGNNRVILLDSNLKWNRILFITNEMEEDYGQNWIRRPRNLFYDEDKKQLIVGGVFYSREGVHVYRLSRT